MSAGGALLGLPATVLPISTAASGEERVTDTWVAQALSKLGYPGLALDELRRFEELLERSRLVREDTYGRKETSQRMRKWLRANRSREARHWKTLTDLKVEHLPYAGENPGTLAEHPA